MLAAGVGRLLLVAGTTLLAPLPLFALFQIEPGGPAYFVAAGLGGAVVRRRSSEAFLGGCGRDAVRMCPDGVLEHEQEHHDEHAEHQHELDRDGTSLPAPP